MVTADELIGIVKFDERGLVPVVTQEVSDGAVLMVAWANAEALRRTAETGLAHFWSRSRKALWWKGETSGHTLRVVEARRAVEEDVAEDVAPLAGRVDGDHQPLVDLALADHLVEALGAEGLEVSVPARGSVRAGRR